MNHDETNSKPDPKPEVHTWIEPELEARVVAWVAGEASAFEIAELERLIVEKPELGIFKRRIEAVQGLVAEAVRPDKEHLRMSEERRAKLLGTIGVAEATGPASSGGRVVVLPEARKRAWWLRRTPQIYFALSGAAAAGLVALLSVSWEHRLRSARPDPSLRMLALPSAVEAPTKASELAEPSMSTSMARNAPAWDTSTSPVQTAMGPSGASAPHITPPTDASFSTAPAQETLTLSPFTVEQKPKWSSILRDGARRVFSGGRDDAQQAGQGRGAPRSPEPDRIVITVPSSSPVIASDKDRRTGDLNAPAEPGVKLDAFTVSESRGGSFGAAAGSSTAAPFSNKLESVSPSTFSEGLKASVDRNASGLADGRATSDRPLVMANGAISVTNGALGVTESATLGGAGGALSTLGSLEEKKTAFAFNGGKEAGAGGAKKASEVDASDQPLRRIKSGVAPDDSLRAEVTAATAPESTFSLHVSDVSFRLAQAALMRGEKPDPARIRPEEFYNAFDYGDTAPANAEKIGARIEQSAHPFLQQRNLVRIAMKVPATGRAAGQPLRLTVLLDTSGSMEREDRAASVRRALQELTALLGPNDRITLIGFARQPRLLAESVPGNQAGGLVDLIARTPAEGGTNLEEALKLGGELARRQLLAGAQNRIIVLTDGAANLGDADPERLARAIATFRQQGIAFDACGVGLDGLDDAVLETLTRNGDGRYYVLGSPNEAGTSFARQLAGSLRPAAENVKLQVRFNPARVGRYRLIGFEQHRLRSEDFRNDQVDAAELAAEEAAVALYQVEVLPQGSGELGDVFVRFRDAATGEMVERSWAIPYEPRAARFERATPSMQLAGTAALFAEKLTESSIGEQFKLGDLAGVVTQLRGHYAHEPRVQELVQMFEQMRRLKRE